MGKYIQKYGQHITGERVTSNVFNDIEMELKWMQMQFDCLCQLLIQKGVIKDKSELDDMLNSREVMEKISRGD